MKDLDYYLNLPYEIIIKKLDEKDGGGYFARYKDFPYIIVNNLYFFKKGFYEKIEPLRRLGFNLILSRIILVF